MEAQTVFHSDNNIITINPSYDPTTDKFTLVVDQLTLKEIVKSIRLLDIHRCQIRRNARKKTGANGSVRSPTIIINEPHLIDSPLTNPLPRPFPTDNSLLNQRLHQLRWQFRIKNNNLKSSSHPQSDLQELSPIIPPFRLNIIPSVPC